MGQHTFNFEAMQTYQKQITSLINEQISKLDAEKTSLETQKSALEQKNAELAQQISSLSSQLSGASEENQSNILSQISALQSEITANESTITSIDTRLSAISSLKSELKSGVEETENYLNKIADAIKEADGDASKAAKAIQDKLAAYNTKIQNIINSVNAYRETYTDTSVGITFDGKDFGVELETTLKKMNQEIDALDRKTLIDTINDIVKFMADSLSDDNFNSLIVSVLKGISNGMKFVNGEMVYVFDITGILPGFEGVFTSKTLGSLKEIMGAGGDALAFLAKHTNIVATIIDFIIMTHNGEDPTDAALKALAHVALSSVASAAGGVIGTAVGTVFGPGFGNAVGFISGVFIGSYASNKFDDFYDEYLQDSIHAADEWVTGKMNDFGNWVQNGVNGFGEWTGGIIGRSNTNVASLVGA